MNSKVYSASNGTFRECQRNKTGSLVLTSWSTAKFTIMEITHRGVKLHCCPQRVYASNAINTPDRLIIAFSGAFINLLFQREASGRSCGHCRVAHTKNKHKTHLGESRASLTRRASLKCSPPAGNTVHQPAEGAGGRQGGGGGPSAQLASVALNLRDAQNTHTSVSLAVCVCLLRWGGGCRGVSASHVCNAHARHVQALAALTRHTHAHTHTHSVPPENFQ